MKILVIHPRITYYDGGGEYYPMDAILQLGSRYPNLSVTVLTSQTPLPYTKRFERFELCKTRNISILKFSLPTEYQFLYSVPAGEIRYRWDMESVAFANIAREFIETSQEEFDILWTFYLMDFPFKTKIPSVLHLLGYPRNASEYREALLAQYSYIVSISENVIRKWNAILSFPLIKQNKILRQGISLNATQNKKRFNNSQLNIVFAGRLIERKGILVLLDAIKELSVIRPSLDFRLHICGDGPLKTAIEDYAFNFSLKSRIILHGQVSNLSELFAEASFCIFPSSPGEGLMTVVLEAMHYNGTVITTTGNGSEEFIIEGQSGYLIEPNNVDGIVNKIIYLIEDPKRIETTKRKAREAVAECSWGNFCRNFVQISENVISQHEK